MKKSSQKVTEFDNLKTVKAVRLFIEENPLKVDKVLNNLQRRLNESYNNKLGKEDKITAMIEECYLFLNKDKSLSNVRNTTYEMNHSRISSCIHNYIIESLCFPSISFISNETGLSRRTIYKHLDAGLNHKYNSIVKGKLDYMATNAMSKLYLIGVTERNATALKHFIELSGALSKSKQTNITNYIQINNLKLSKEEFEQLPPETILEIEKLINSNL